MGVARRIGSLFPDSVRDPIRRIRRGETRAQTLAAEKSLEVSTWLGLDRGQGDLVFGSPAHPRRAEVVSSFDGWALQASLASELREVLDQTGLEYVVLPSEPLGRPTLVVSGADRTEALSALAAAASLSSWWFAPERGGRLGTPRPVGGVQTLKKPPVSLVLFRYLAAPNGRLLADESWGVRIEFWRRIKREGIPRPDGEAFEPGTLVAPSPNRAATYLQPADWDAAQADASHWLPTAGLPNLLDVNEPIDLVYTWVDGNDPAWQARKRAAMGGATETDHNPDAFLEARFVSRDELRYSLRSVEMFASWVNHIWIVTDQQVPSWLRTDHPKLSVVDHRGIFADPDALPVFNSHAIESQLHHIDGLSQRYLYLNDDMLFGRPVTPELFFFANGLTKLFKSNAVVDVSPRSSHDIAVSSAAKNNRELLETTFGRTITNKLWHTPYPQSRAVLYEMEERFPKLFEQVMRSRFRHPDDYSIPSSLHHWYAFATGRAAPDRLRYGYVDLASPDAARVLSDWSWMRNHDCYCLNDTADDPTTATARDTMVNEFLTNYYPVPSTFEVTTS